MGNRAPRGKLTNPLWSCQTIHLMALNIQGSLLDLMRLFKGRTAKGLRGDVAGPLWQRAFHDHLLRRNVEIHQTLLYMFENPVRAGLVEGGRIPVVRIISVGGD